MNPVPVMKLVEIIRGLATSDETYALTEELSKSLGKTPVEVNDAPGFVSNRVLMPLINEAIYAHMEGVASVEAIDTVMKLGMNHPMGPLTLADFIGLDVCLSIMRVLYAHAEKTFSFQVIEAALDDYKTDLDSFDARIQMRLSFPVKVDSLRSGLSGYQYYDIALELIERDGVRRKILHLDYVYSSTCPCSLELSEHARDTRNQMATPHSQRSVARLSVEVDCDQNCLWFEDLIDMARRAVPTETQVMVKREDEQAFAELNAANPIFVEDAARLFAEQLQADPRIGDFRVVASHQESLHSHDAVSVLTEGDTFDADSLDPRLFASLFHVG